MAGYDRVRQHWVRKRHGPRDREWLAVRQLSDRIAESQGGQRTAEIAGGEQGDCRRVLGQRVNPIGMIAILVAGALLSFPSA